jgi:hypothetical protein
MKIGRRVPRYDLHQQRDATLNRTIANRVKVTIGSQQYIERATRSGCWSTATTDRVDVAIGRVLNYRSGSATLATMETGSGQRHSCCGHPSNMNCKQAKRSGYWSKRHHSQQCQCDHWQPSGQRHYGHPSKRTGRGRGRRQLNG